MEPKLEYSCGIDGCKNSFQLKRELQDHLHKHQRLAVLCVNCPITQSFLSPDQLRQHYTETHQSHMEELGNDFLSDENCLWFSMYPKDYGRTIKVPNFDSPLSRMTREKVLEWSKQQQNPPKTVDDWQNEWDSLLLEDTTSETLATITPPDEATFVPDYVDDALDCSPEEPEFQTEKELQLDDITIRRDGATALFISSQEQDTWYEAELKLEAVTQKMNYDPLLRKTTLRKLREQMPTVGGIPLEGKELGVRRTTLATVLGCEESLILSVTRRTNLPAPDQVSIHLSGSEEEGFLSGDESKECPTTTQKQETNRRSSSAEIKRPVLSRRIPEPVLHIPTSDQDPTGFSDPKQMPTIKQKESDQHSVVAGTKRPSSPSRITSKVTKVRSSRRYGNHTLNPHFQSTQASSQNSKRCNHNQGFSTATRSRLPEANETPLMKDAKDILIFGCMPLLPPARRDWGDDPVKLRVGTTALNWPPRNWEKLSPDRRLLQWEFAAMFFEHARTTRIPSLSRHDLRDRYNMLALPGTHIQQQTEDGESPYASKARLYNYTVLASIAAGESATSHDQDVVNTWKQARQSRNRDVDCLIEAINRSGVGLLID